MNKKIIIWTIVGFVLVILITIVLGILLKFSDIIIAACIEGFLGFLCVAFEMIVGSRITSKTNSNNKQSRIVVKGKIKAKNIIGGDIRNSDEKTIAGNVDRNSEIYIEANDSEVENIVGGNYTK